MVLSFLLLCVLFIENLSALKRSTRFLKAKEAAFAFPIDVCYNKNIGGLETSIKLVCEKSPPNCVDSDGNCKRNVISYHYNSNSCQGVPLFNDKFVELDPSYPLNCYEEEELDGTEIDPTEFAPQYMVLSVTKGMIIEDENDTNETSCVRDESSDFVKTLPALTNHCTLGWTGTGRGARPYWYKLHCTDEAFLIERYSRPNCTGNQTTDYPVYVPNGCGAQQWNGHWWFTEVKECSNPNFLINIGYRNTQNLFVSFAFMVSIILHNL